MMHLGMRSKDRRLERAWVWCGAVTRETWSTWRATAGLIRRDPWKPLALIAVLYFLPAAAAERAAGSFMLLSMFRSFLCMPLLFAALARLQLATLRGGSVRLVDTVREKIRQWRELLMLALISMMLAQTGSFVAAAATQLLLVVAALLAWIPLLGTVVSAVLSALATVFSLFCGLLFSQAVYFAWLTQEAEGNPVMLALPAAWRFVRARVRPVIGLYLGLAIAEGVLWIAFRGAAGVDPLFWTMLEALLMLLSASYAATLFVGDKGANAHDPYSAPVDLERMKRANVRED